MYQMFANIIKTLGNLCILCPTTNGNFYVRGFDFNKFHVQIDAVLRLDDGKHIEVLKAVDVLVNICL